MMGRNQNFLFFFSSDLLVVLLVRMAARVLLVLQLVWGLALGLQSLQGFGV